MNSPTTNLASPEAKTLKYLTSRFHLNMGEKSPISIPDTDRGTLAELFRELEFKKGVEVGILEGEYSEVICAANPGALLYCVDPWAVYKGYREHKTQSKMDDLYEKTKERLKNYNVKYVRKFSMDATKDFEDNSLDFVYIDGNHSYESALEDITEWSKKVRPGGIVSGHDFRWNRGSLIKVVEAVTYYTNAHNISFFVLGRKEILPGEKRDRHRSWMWVKSSLENEVLNKIPEEKTEENGGGMLGKWNKWYKKVKVIGSFWYGDTVTYKLAADFLADMPEVEDWGSGAGGFKRFYNGKYIGVDGSQNPFVDKVADLTAYQSEVDGLVMRHVLEHNYAWRKILSRAILSFKKKFCLIIFTPFQAETGEIAHNKKHGVDVPDIAFAKSDIEWYLTGFKWRMETHKTKTGYGIEYIYYIEK